MTNEDTLMRLDGKTVLLIGATGILGSVFSEYLLRAGAVLVIADLDGAVVAARVAELAQDHGERVHGFAVDIAHEPSMRALADQVAAAGLAVDVLINNAATKSPNFFKPLGDFPLKDWNHVMGVNVGGIFLALKTFLPGMIARGGGTVVNTGSIYGELGPDQRIYDGSWYEAMGGAINTPLVYSASKGAVSAITRYVATTFGDQGIRCNTLVPGGVFSGQNETFVAKYSARIPLGRMADKDEIARALLFLASSASSYVNGQELLVDGGLSAW